MISLFFHLIFLFIIPNIELAFFAADKHYSLGLPVSLIITPRSLSSLVQVNMFPFILYLAHIFFLPRCITTHLSTLNVICHWFAQSTRKYKSFCNNSISSGVFTPRPNFVSSANLHNNYFEQTSLSIIIYKHYE